jgi:hypothetical protein
VYINGTRIVNPSPETNKPFGHNFQGLTKKCSLSGYLEKIAQEKLMHSYRVTVLSKYTGMVGTGISLKKK